MRSASTPHFLLKSTMDRLLHRDDLTYVCEIAHCTRATIEIYRNLGCLYLSTLTYRFPLFVPAAPLLPQCRDDLWPQRLSCRHSGKYMTILSSLLLIHRENTFNITYFLPVSRLMSFFYLLVFASMKAQTE